MQLTIFGATGRTGAELVQQALADGHTVTAYVRNPAKLTVSHDRLRVVAGTMDDLESIRRAVAGADAVLSALGPVTNTAARPLTEGMGHIVAAMQHHGVRRLIITTGAGVADPLDTPGLVGRFFNVMLRLFARHVLADSIGMVDVVRASDRDWTVVRVPRLNDNPGGGPLRVGYSGQGPGTQLARADFARFMLDQLASAEWLRRAPMISN